MKCPLGSDSSNLAQTALSPPPRRPWPIRDTTTGDRIECFGRGPSSGAEPGQGERQGHAPCLGCPSFPFSAASVMQDRAIRPSISARGHVLPPAAAVASCLCAGDSRRQSLRFGARVCLCLYLCQSVLVPILAHGYSTDFVLTS